MMAFALNLSPLGLAALGGILGLIIGSFLNVVIHRLPRMMERQWARDCAELQGQAPAPDAAPFNLAQPRSHCPHCNAAVAWQHNIPLLSYLALRGRCASCRQPIAALYPLVELSSGLLFAYSFWRWGGSPTALAWYGFSAALLALACIDWQTTLLPDDITLPLLWAGLLVAALGWNGGLSVPDAVWGAAAGYTALWLVYQIFKQMTGQEGMGYGDFKLFAALGAWFGWQALPPLILMASLTGALVGLSLRAWGRLEPGAHIPFGPYLAAAGLVGMVWGPEALLHWSGF